MTNCAFIVGNLIFNRKIPLQTCPGAEAPSWGASQINAIHSQGDNFEGITVKVYQNPILDSETYKMSFTSVCNASVPFLWLHIDVCENGWKVIIASFLFQCQSKKNNLFLKRR